MLLDYFFIIPIEIKYIKCVLIKLIKNKIVTRDSFLVQSIHKTVKRLKNFTTLIASEKHFTLGFQRDI
jgi:hypothetical protein